MSHVALLDILPEGREADPIREKVQMLQFLAGEEYPPDEHGLGPGLRLSQLHVALIAQIRISQIELREEFFKVLDDLFVEASIRCAEWALARYKQYLDDRILPSDLNGEKSVVERSLRPLSLKSDAVCAVNAVRMRLEDAKRIVSDANIFHSFDDRLNALLERGKES